MKTSSRNDNFVLLLVVILCPLFPTKNWANGERVELNQSDFRLSVQIEKLLDEPGRKLGLYASVMFENNSKLAVCIGESSMHPSGTNVFVEGDPYPIKFIGSEPRQFSPGGVYLSVMPSSSASNLSKFGDDYKFRKGKFNYYMEHKFVVYDCRDVIEFYEKNIKDERFSTMSVYDSIERKITVSSGRVGFTHQE